MLLKSAHRVLAAAAPVDVVAAFPQLVRNAVVASESVLFRHLFTTARVYHRTLRLECQMWGFDRLTGAVLNFAGCQHLDRRGIARSGSLVRRNDILAGGVRHKLTGATAGNANDDEVAIALVYPHDDPGVVLGHQIQSRLTGVCPECGETPLWVRENACPHCRSPLAQVRTNDAFPGDHTLIRVEYVVRRDLAVGDILRTPDGRLLTVAAILPEAQMPTMDNVAVDMLLHPESDAAGLLCRTGRVFHPSLSDKPESSRHGSWDRPRLKKVTPHLERKCAARAVGRYDAVTQQPLVRDDEPAAVGDLAQRLPRDAVVSLLHAGFPLNVCEMLTVKSDDVGGRAAAHEATVKGGVLERSEEGPEAARRVLLLLQAAGFDAAWPPAADWPVRLATAAEVHAGSFGEVRSGETFCPRTLRVVKDGLYCERIFGPKRAWECACGQYQGMTYQGMVCDRCGVKVTHSQARRRRMGHIELAAPVVHPWFCQTTDALEVALRRPREHLLALVYLRKDLLADPSGGRIVGPNEAQRTADPTKVVLRGGDAVRHLLETRGLTSLLPAVFTCLPVLPPGLRPSSPTAGTHPLSLAYQAVIAENACLAKAIRQGQIEQFVLSWQSRLQSAVTSLFVGTKQSPGCLRMELAEAAGRLVAKSVDYSARGTAVPDAAIKPGRVGVPRTMAARLYGPVVIRLLLESGHADILKVAKRLVDRNDEPAAAALPVAVASRPLLVLGPTAVPTGLQPVLIEGEAVRLHPDDGSRLGLTYAGDAVTLHLPLTAAAVEELSRPTPWADAATSLADLTATSVVQAAVSGRPLNLTGLDRIACGLSGLLADAPVAGAGAMPAPPSPPTPEEPNPAPAPAGPAIPLAELGLSVRATSCLESEGITTTADLVLLTAEELLEVRNFGETTLQEVKKKLAAFGLKLRGE